MMKMTSVIDGSTTSAVGSTLYRQMELYQNSSQQLLSGKLNPSLSRVSDALADNFKKIDALSTAIQEVKENSEAKAATHKQESDRYREQVESIEKQLTNCCAESF